MSNSMRSELMELTRVEIELRIAVLGEILEDKNLNEMDRQKNLGELKTWENLLARIN